MKPCKKISINNYELGEDAEDFHKNILTLIEVDPDVWMV